MSNDPVLRPAHYRQGKHEAISVIREWKLSFALGNVLKYICRAGLKDPSKIIEDLEKAREYLDDEIEYLKSEVK